MTEDKTDKLFFVRRRNHTPAADFKMNAADWDIENEVSKLSAFMQIVDQKKIRSFFLELEEMFFSSGKCAREIRHECIILMIETRSNLKNKFPAIKQTLVSANEILDEITQLPALEEITDAMIDSALSMSECFSLLSADGNFMRIVSFVRNNYSEDLRLENLGKLFGYNSAYLGKRFRKYTGKCFNTYLDMLRIDEAKKLLQSSSMKVYEISTAVGYGNADYFYVKFKKYTGQNPLFFREKQDS